MIIKLKYLVQDIDRHGNVRSYVRIKGEPKVRIRGLPASEEFMAAYHEALSGRAAVAERKKYKTPAQGSFGYVCLAYYASPTFKALDISTQKWRRRALDEICIKHGEKPISQLQFSHVLKLRDEKAATPGAARNRLKALRALFVWAINNKLGEHNPTVGLPYLKYKKREHHTWTIEEVEAFEARHPIGSKARLAMALMLYTACRREDVVRFGPRQFRNGRVQFRQAKNEHGDNPVDIDIPVHPDLAAIIAAMPSSGKMTFLTTEFGKPFSPSGFGNKFRDWCDQAGLPHCSAHGLRKAIAARLAEQEASAHEIMAVTGHQTLEEVERYTRQARRKKLADSAMSKLKK
jgi:integrase/recombinase XerD